MDEPSASSAFELTPGRESRAGSTSSSPRVRGNWPLFAASRLFEIIAVMTRHAAPFTAAALWRAITFGKMSGPRQHPARAIRLMLEQLGGAFVKFGQILAMRPDVLPADYIVELSALLDAVPPFPGDEAVLVIECELGAPISGIFRQFDRTPIAAASFAQVHRAILLNGDAVVVKVQRPGLRRVAAADIRIVVAIAHVVDFLGLMKRVRLHDLADEFKEWTEEELDLRVEATYAQRVRDASKDDPNSHIPLIYWEYTTRVVMTMEYLDGVWLSQVLARVDTVGLERARRDLADRGIDLDRVASNILDNSLRQVFEHRVFHADPHAGNLVVLDNNVIGYVDFGITGQLDSEFRSTQLMLYDALQRGDNAQYMRAIYRIMKPPPNDIDLDAFEREIRKNATAWQNSLHNPCATLQERSSSWLFARNLKVTRKYGLEVSQMALRYYRALAVIELIILRLSPTFDFVKALSVYLQQLELRELARDVRLEAGIRQMFASRRLVRDGMVRLHMMLNARELNEGVARRQVSRWRLTLAFVLRGMALAAILGLIGMLMPFMWPARVAEWTARIGTGRAVLLLFTVALCSAWGARRLYISSARHGPVIPGRG
jgi:ubiquinone biosynthesis protein